MGTHQQTWPVLSSPEARTSSAEDQFQFQLAHSADMDFTSLYHTMNQDEQLDMNLFGLADLKDDRELWASNRTSSGDGVLGLVAEESVDELMYEQKSTAPFLPNASSYDNLTQGFPNPVPRQRMLQQGRQLYQQSLQSDFSMERSAYIYEKERSNYEAQRSMQQPDYYKSYVHNQDSAEETNTSWMKAEHGQLFSKSDNYDEDDISDGSDPCYAQLLYRCLKEAPDRTMTLKDVYDWVAQNSKKASDPSNRGWQNSVRHNLSMNKAFERVSPSTNPGQKKGSLWRLTEKALCEGVISTTRFRKDPKRKPDRRSFPAPKRQASGAKGGQATKRAANARYAKLQKSRRLFVPAEVGHSLDQGTDSPLVDMYPTSHARVTSPQPSMYTHTAPNSPYFFDQRGHTSSFTSNPITPPPIPLSCSGDVKQFLPQYNFQHIDFDRGDLFGSRDDVLPGTPSLASETSMPTDDGGHALSHHASRETTFC